MYDNVLSRVASSLAIPQESHLPDWQLIAIAGNVGINKDFLEMFVDVLPMSSSPTAFANATKVY